MSLFNKVLQEITNKLFEGEEKRQTIINEIKKETGIPLSPGEIKTSKKGLFFSVSPTKKAALLMKKESIEEIFKRNKTIINW